MESNEVFECECGYKTDSKNGLSVHKSSCDGRNKVKECAWCDEEFYVPPSQLDEMGDYSLDNHFCDKECESSFKQSEWVGEDHPSWDGGNVELQCDYCGDTFDVVPAKADGARFCSRKCSSMIRDVGFEEVTCS